MTDLFNGDPAGRLLAKLVTFSDDPHMANKQDMLRQVSLRLPFHLLAKVEAITAQTGGAESRNTIICDLIESGYQVLIERLPIELVEEINQEIEARFDHEEGV